MAYNKRIRLRDSDRLFIASAAAGALVNLDRRAFVRETGREPTDTHGKPAPALGTAAFELKRQ